MTFHSNISLYSRRDSSENEIFNLSKLSWKSGNEDWTEPFKLFKLIDRQNKLISEGLFDPIEYFGWTYMKDYKFYLK